MKTILILMDSLNRNMLSAYNPQTWIKTPNIDRLAAKSLVCNNHWAGSLPCMPARRDLFTGRYNFLERNWGPIEPYDITLQEKLRAHGIFTHMTTDHNHYFEIGGENYCQLFNTWDFHRGQEFDPWVSRVDRPALPKKYYGKVSEQYELNRTKFIKEEDYSSPRTFKSACEWLEENNKADQFFLMIDSFDPHEPFDCTEEYLELYNDDYEGPRYDWSGYKPVNEPPEAMEHLKKRYAATLSMNDKWLGKLLDLIENQHLWEDTLIIFTTDHGHLLGEHNFVGKNETHVYNELAHIPLFVHLPGGQRAGERVQELTQTIDFMPTILDYYGIEAPPNLHGYSLKSIFEGDAVKVRDAAIYGYHGKAVNITDGKYTYFRSPVEGNQPCYNYCAIPTTLWKYMGRDQADEIEMGRFLKHTNFPVVKIPSHGGKLDFIKKTELFDIEADYKQEHPIRDEKLERELIDTLIEAMRKADAPEEQFERLGLNCPS